jgi:hypothetical protein
MSNSQTSVANYTQACNAASSITEIDSDVCQVFEGSNEGFFVEAFGKRYRYHIECPKQIAKYFMAIVSVGPVAEVR